MTQKRVIVISVITCFVMMCLDNASRIVVPPTVNCSNLSVLDENGNVALTLGSNEHGGMIAVFDTGESRARDSIGIKMTEDGARIFVLGPHSAATLGSGKKGASIYLSDVSTEARLGVNGDEHSSTLFFDGAGGSITIQLKGNSKKVYFADKDGEITSIFSNKQDNDGGASGFGITDVFR